MTISAADILAVTRKVTKVWTKQRKAEEQGRSHRTREYIYSDRVNFTDVVNSILPPAYRHASGNGKFTVSKRQLYYACREQFRQKTGRELEAQYFSNTLLVQYLNRNPAITSAWKITADPRGTLTIANAAHEVRVGCGTLQIEDHLDKARQEVEALDIDASLDIEWPSLAAGQRYQAVLYIEKEGFEPLLKEARIAERYDVAILSCKGQSVIAARQFVDEVCAVGRGVRLLIVHDFDKSGFEIAQRLTKVSDWAVEYDRVAYEFRNDIDVTDLGLRLADVRKYRLASETVKFTGRFAGDSTCTAEEQEFLRSGRRVELNAFSSPQFIVWLESKLDEHLPKRLIPADDVLEAAYRRALAVATINAAVEAAKDVAIAQAESTKIPKTLRRQLAKSMNDRAGAWDTVLYDLATESIEE